MGGRERHYVDQAFTSNFIAPLGPQLTQFEEVIAGYVGAGVHTVGLSSGSAALHLALRCHGVEKGDEVWISSMTFAGGIFPLVYLEAVPVFFDLDPRHWTIDCNLIEEALEKADRANRLPKAIVPTDLYGQSVDLDRLESIAQRWGVALVVDSAESFGAAYLDGRKCGSGGDSAIISFNGNKIITTSGGGMLISKHPEIVEQARFYATQARDPAPHYEHSTFGYNYRLSNILAGIGLGQMEVLDERVLRRREINRRYRNELQSLGFEFMPEPEGYFSSCWLTAMLVDPDKCGVDREQLRHRLLENEIESRPLWKPMHLQPLFAGARYEGAGFDEKLFTNGLCLPSGSDLTESEQSEVIDIIKQVCADPQ